ncbi:CBS domain-containing protein [Lottiidibacillus patelloidae]|uniref:CBS domain-containing protein n=1 Tax=Lottiidibacillus patelloidae TaxID=2670334 RepID=A0A263BXK9_9BACI|nr:CBS domain-containing protein [Lottiidibacillus patelloidae]OZM58473.1 CBS domain-containing protein [Lottiidibacillus patelloidae]
MGTLQEIMTKNVEYCTPLDNVYEVALKMKQLNVGAIPICEDEHLLGMITDRDIVVRAMAEKKPGSTKVTDIMSNELITGSPDMTTEEASKIMAEKQIRRLPVVENSKLCGIVSLGDLAVRNETDEQAGYALSEISEQDHMQQ